MSELKHGDSVSFDETWQKRREAYYAHWTQDEPQNQIQLAFRNHWSLFNELMKSPHFNQGKRTLEVGCGRGSLSCYFSDAGYDCTLLDISESIIDVARKIFEANNLKAAFKVGDAIALPFEDKSFDIVFSIGLLEHFEDIEPPIREQIRVLDNGGLLIGYVVPKYTDSIQKDFEWINEILKGYVQELDSEGVEKKEVFRSDTASEQYISILEKYGLRDIHASGVYPIPMISHSIEFPFTLMPEQSEKALVRHLTKMLEENGKRTGKHPWLCEEGFGQAFIIWGFRQ